MATKFDEREVVLVTKPLHDMIGKAADETQMKRSAWWRLAAMNQLRIQGVNFPNAGAA